MNMKCRHCQRKAIINLRQHKLTLCKDHFLAWVLATTDRSIQKHKMFGHDEKILVAVSGGKDSLALWDILNRLDYQTEGLYIGLGIDEGIQYSEESRQLTESFACERALDLHVIDLPVTYGSSIPQLAEKSSRGRTKPCSICGLAKRHIMNRVAREGNYDVLATGHNLDDEAATLFGNTINWREKYLQKQSPVLKESPGLVRKVKPLFRFYEREMAAYALLRGIEYIQEECPFSFGAASIHYKELLNQLEAKSPGAKQYFYLHFLRARENGLVQFQENETNDPQNICLNCGQLTHSQNICSFCKMLGRS